MKINKKDITYYDIAKFIIDEIEKGETVDTGGYTKYGISKKAFPDLDIENLTKDDAIQIYYQHYWVKSKAYLIYSYYSKALAVTLFDFSINAHYKRASKVLQQTLNQINSDRSWINLKVDGIIGKKTLTALEVALKTEDEKIIFWLYNKNRIHFYNKISRRKKYRKYLHGWINRVEKIERYVLEILF